MALLIPTLAGGSPAFRVPSLSAGVGGAALTWVPITAADITATRDTSALEDNAPVDVAGGKLRMRATSSATQVGASNGVTYSIALPGGVADGSNGRLLIRITLDAVLPTPWHLHMGLYSAANVWALTAGVRWVNATSKMRPVAGVLAAVTDGLDCSATATLIEGIIDAPGSYDGVDSTGGGALVSVTDGSTYSPAARISGSLPVPTTADTRVCISLQHTNSGFTDVLDSTAKFEYAVQAAP